MFVPIYGTRNLLWILDNLNNLNTISKKIVLIFECATQPKPHEILDRCIDHGCTSVQYLQTMDLLASGRCVTVSGDYYTGKLSIEAIDTETFVREQVAAGRREAFAMRIAEACEYVVKHPSRRGGYLPHVQEY